MAVEVIPKHTSYIRTSGPSCKSSSTTRSYPARQKWNLKRQPTKTAVLFEKFFLDIHVLLGEGIRVFLFCDQSPSNNVSANPEIMLQNLLSLQKTKRIILRVKGKVYPYNGRGFLLGYMSGTILDYQGDPLCPLLNNPSAVGLIVAHTNPKP